MMADFFAMGGFGSFIWGSHGLAVIMLVWLGVSSWRKSTQGRAAIGAVRD